MAKGSRRKPKERGSKVEGDQAPKDAADERQKAPDAAGEASEKSPEGPVRDPKVSARVGAVIDQVNKEMKGSGHIYAGSEMTPTFWHRRPTGILGLDAEAAGGIPGGAITQIIAKDGVGKTTLCNFIMAENQRIFGARSSIAVATIEGQFDKPHAREGNVRIAYSVQELANEEKARGIKFDPATKKALLEDQVGEFYEPRAATAEALLEEVLALIRSNAFQLIFIDSIGALVPAAVEEKTMEDKHYGGIAALMTQFCQKYFGIMGLKDEEGEFNRTSLVAINQYRMQIGGFQPHGPQMKIQGGHALMHAKLLDIELRSTPGDRLLDDSKRPFGKTVHWRIIKQKGGGHEGEVGEYDYIYDTHGVNLAKDAFAAGVKYGVIQRRGSAYYIWRDKTYHGDASLIDELKNRETRDALRKEVFASQEIYCLVGE